jgi:hypothetical protein
MVIVAKGGGCFLAGTSIRTPHGGQAIEGLQQGDTVVSWNERLQKTELAEITRIVTYQRAEYYIINHHLRVTAEHPIYTTRGLVAAEEIKLHDWLYDELHREVEVLAVERVQAAEDVTVYNLIDVTPNNNYFANGLLVHNKGGGGARSSSARSSSSSSKTSTSSKSTPAPPAKPKPGVSKAVPGAAIKTADGKTVVSSTKRPAKSEYSRSTGVVGDNGYTPRFANGYSAPPGSVVYYPQHSALDYLPWIYLFSQDSPQHDQAVIMQPDGKEVQAPPVQEGVDGMVIVNWIILVIIIAAVCAGIVYLVNKLTRRPPTTPVHSFYS